MAKADDIVDLIRLYYTGDGKRFEECVARIVARLKGANNQQSRNLLERIENLLRDTKAQWATMSPEDAFYTKDLLDGGLAWFEKSQTRLCEMVLSDELRHSLAAVVRERAAAEKLRSHGLEPARKILCFGPPGTGKTMSAAALAGELDLPLYVVSSEKVVERFLGNTAQNLGKIFNVIKRAEGVWFFDEFDSLARARTGGRGGDAEMSRVMGAMLQFIERDRSNSIIMAATNMPKLLDKALFRRFDLIINYENPSYQQILSLITGAAASVGLENVLDIIPPEREQLSVLARQMEGYNHATVVRACREAAKNLILDEKQLLWETFLPELEKVIRSSGAANSFRNAVVGAA